MLHIKALLYYYLESVKTLLESSSAENCEDARRELHLGLGLLLAEYTLLKFV
jgi:hypothetical protein